MLVGSAVRPEPRETMRLVARVPADALVLILNNPAVPGVEDNIGAVVEPLPKRIAT